MHGSASSDDLNELISGEQSQAVFLPELTKTTRVRPPFRGFANGFAGKEIVSIASLRDHRA